MHNRLRSLPHVKPLLSSGSKIGSHLFCRIPAWPYKETGQLSVELNWPTMPEWALNVVFVGCETRLANFGGLVLGSIENYLLHVSAHFAAYSRSIISKHIHQVLTTVGKLRAKCSLFKQHVGLINFHLKCWQNLAKGWPIFSQKNDQIYTLLAALSEDIAETAARSRLRSSALTRICCRPAREPPQEPLQATLPSSLRSRLASREKTFPTFSERSK